MVTQIDSARSNGSNHLNNTSKSIRSSEGPGNKSFFKIASKFFGKSSHIDSSDKKSNGSGRKERATVD